MRIASLLQSKGAFVATIAPGQTLEEVLAALAQHGVGALVVTDDGEHITGIVSERDVACAPCTGGASRCSPSPSPRS